MENELNKLVGFTVECYPTLRSEREPISPTRLWYEVYPINDMDKFAHGLFDTVSFTNSDDKEKMFFNFMFGKDVRWRKYLSAKNIRELTSLYYYHGFIWMHMKLSFIYVEDDTDDEKISDMLKSHESEKLDFDTDVMHFAHNECGPDHVLKPAFILTDKIQPVRDTDGYFIMILEKRCSVSDWYVENILHLSE